MKKFLTVVIVFFIYTITFGQTPEKMSYQAVLRDANNVLIVNQQVGMRISILQGETAIYAETQTPTTNTNGLVTLEIGTGSVALGTFSSIDWGSGVYFIKTEIDPSGSNSYSVTGINQILSVPYALHSKTSENGISAEQSDAINANLEKYTRAQIDSIILLQSNARLDSINNINQKIDSLLSTMDDKISQIENSIISTNLINIFPDGDFSEGDSEFTLTDNFSNGTGELKLDKNGINWNVTDFKSGNLEAYKFGIPLKPSMRYAVSVEYVVNSCNLNQANYDIGFSLNFRADSSLGGSVVTTAKYGKQMISSQIMGETIRTTVIIETSENVIETTNGRFLANLRYTGLANTGTSLDITLETVKMYELGRSSVNNKLYDLHPININKLVRGTFDNVPVDDFIESLKESPYYGRYLIAWGHSVVKQNMWQQQILAAHGMLEDLKLYVDEGADGFPDTAVGGSYLVPVIANTDTKAAGANHYMKLRNNFEQYNDYYTNEYGKPVHLFMFNFNGKNLGQRYVDGNTFVVDTFGLNDTAWDFEAFGEIDLINNPSETNVPSFGAAYRAALDFVFSIDRGSDIKLVNAYSAPSYAIVTKEGHNEVTDKMGDEYGLQVLEVDKLWSSVNWHYYLKDSIHLAQKGGQKFGETVAKQMKSN